MKKDIEITKPILTVNKWKFIVWLFIVTIIMFFAAFTSAYLVRRAEGNWTEFEIPPIFYYSTAVLLLSSVFMHLGYKAAKKDNFNSLKLYISITFVAGMIFLVMQYMGWTILQKEGVFLKGNPAESFYYILTGLHGFHLVTGLVVLFFSFLEAFKMNIHAKNLIRIEVCATYWHFLDILWVYLLLFLVFFR
ncbi:CyoC Heme/copper-type cytochrome/quinol oxidase, subunit 3 [Spirosomataceae bacterium]|jgi:cytochrome c oxidase subunit 3